MYSLDIVFLGKIQTKHNLNKRETDPEWGVLHFELLAVCEPLVCPVLSSRD